MKALASFFHRAAMLAVLPAALAFTACSNDDDDNTTPTPDQGKVMLVHAAAASNVQVTAFVNDQQVGQLNYGQNSSYLNVNAGTPTLRINNGSTVLTSQGLTVAKDQSYSAFAYSPSATIGATPSLLVTPDDLTAPASGQAKVRIVHLAVNAPTPVRLTAPSAVPGTPGADITPDIAFGAASSFFPVNAGPLNLSITAGTPRTQVRSVGDGTGSGIGTKNYEAGKIYTIVVRGIAGAGVPAAQEMQAVIIQNN
ncbi:DUF4397 domain-containing protein [Hymenobacter weizhouensis]|uniref:DUF4397 domain-containing protein n=1 Tax=Hymenobacter sp. YIM 151500-1 TaxID=2987689 RepID=UPI0022273F31|nr:DUF4397 domain-containing protein [Hymenobacter sp. YIM 151500-1]UYZ62855.1 DUF4397 domain-containing protein [Hymenobacter sp. YIM 151500-1]